VKLGFEESQSAYSSGSQSARAWTEAWVSAWAYCPHCGNAKISPCPNNSLIADFFCTSCGEEFELKSQKGKFGTRVVDGAFKTFEPLAQFPLQWLHPSRRIAEPVIGRAFARPVGDAPRDEVSGPHGEERVFARLES
jgi:predicted RNA-binding Zn-ribbon protein involved in translation (DUF1610 family)